MSFRERVRRFLSVLRAWIRLRRACCLCGYGVVEGWPGDEPEVPEVYSGIDSRDGTRWRQWCHEGCYDQAE